MKRTIKNCILCCGLLVFGMHAVSFAQVSISLLSPESNAIVTTKKLQVVGNAKGASKVSINGNEVKLGKGGDFNYSYKLRWPNDYDTVTIVALRDGEKVVLRRRVFFKEKKRGPVIMISSPEQDSVQQSSLLTVKGAVVGAQRLFVENKEVALSPEGRFSYTIRLNRSEPVSTLSLRAIDQEGRETELQRIIHNAASSNRKLPQVTVKTPNDNEVTYNDRVTLKGRTMHVQDLFINDRWIRINDNGQFEASFDLSDYGKYGFSILAKGYDNEVSKFSHHVYRIEQASPRFSQPLEERVEKNMDKLVSLNLAGADLKDVIHILAKKAQLNVVTDPGISGQVVVALNDVRVIDAIDFVLSSQGFSYSISGNTILIGMQAALDQPSRLETKIVRLDNRKPADLMPILKSYLVAGESVQSQGSLLVMIADRKKMPKLSAVIKRLDAEKTPQIILEAHILEVTQSALDNLGVAWSGKYTATAELTGTKGAYTDTISLKNLSAIVNALATEGKAKVISKPRIKAIHGQQAEIFIGDKEPYVELTMGAGGNISQSINYVNVGINLSVLPEINAHTQDIKIKISPEVSYINGYKGENNDIPVVRTRRVNTTVVVKNRSTVLIGGLFKSSDQDAVSRMPIISRIPLLGFAFKSKKKEDEQTELVIAITPQIIDETFEDSIPIPIDPKAS